MSRRITLREPPAPVEPPVAGQPFRLRYVAANETGQPTAGHWDYLAIVDGRGDVHVEEWLPAEPLGPYGRYEAVIGVDVALPAGTYAVSLTLDGSGEGAEAENERLAILRADANFLIRPVAG